MAENNSRTPIPNQHHVSGAGGIIMPDTHSYPADQPHPSPKSEQHPRQISGISIAQYPEFSLPYQNNTRDNIPPYENSIDGRIGSSQDIRTAHDGQDHGSFSSAGRGPITAPDNNRTSISSMGKGGFQHRNGSIDGSDAASPASSREFGFRASDDSLPLAHLATKDKSPADPNNNDDKEKRPPWSELKTKAGKERKRLPLACIACRRKKIRCSGEKPACKHCLRSRIPCVYKVTTRRAAPRTDYMAMLDKRLKRMEERVIKIIPNQDPIKLSKIGRANVKPPVAQTPKIHGLKKRAADEAFGNELDEWVRASTSNAAELSREPSKAEQTERSLLAEGREYLPPEDIQEHLAEVYFDCLYGQSYLLLHKPSFMRKLRTHTVPPVLILAVCALAARFSTHPKVNTEPAFLRGEPWAKPARDIALRRYDEPNITILTALLVLGLHEFGTCHGGRSWMVGGMAMRMAYALQLHRESDHDPLSRKNDETSELSFTDREIRRRTMWACFLMDRFNSSGTDRPMFSSEENIRIQLPIREAHFQMEIPGPTETLEGDILNPVSPDAGQISNPKENMGVAAYMIRIIALWGRVIKYLNLGGRQRDKRSFWDPKSEYALLRQQTLALRASLPESLKYTSENLQNHAAEKLANQFLFMHLAYNQTLLFLHKFAIPASPAGQIPKEMPREFVNEAAQTAIETANKISSLLNDASEHLVAAPFAGYCAFTSSTVHVWCIFSKNPQLVASSTTNLAYNWNYLKKMKKYWGMFHYMSENLKDIYRQHADATRKGLEATSQEKGNTNEFQYGDWFNRYPNGVSKTDYEDPAAEAENETGTDAALSQKSDLQSVENFFSTLSTPTETADSRKIPRNHAGGSVHQEQASQAMLDVKKEQQKLSQQVLQQQHMMMNFPQRYQQQRTQVDSTAFLQNHFATTQSAFPGTNFGPTSVNLSLQGLPLGDLSRQLGFDNFSGSDPTGPSPDPSLGHLNNNASLWDTSINFPQGLGACNGYGDITSSAWFMPFNLNPPDLTSDGEFMGLGTFGVDVVHEGHDGQGMGGDLGS